jgi:nucleoside-triphosphatase THEP1
MNKIRIISGPWNTGKTGKLLEIYEGLDKGTADGFASIKVYDEAKSFIGYSLKQLSSGQIFPLAILKEKYNNQFEETFEFERFAFSVKTFKTASETLEELIQDEMIETILLDEIGHVELMGRGFGDVFKKIIHSDKYIYAVINECWLGDVIGKYEIKYFETEYIVDN